VGSSVSSSLNKGRVLVVDDNPSNLRLLLQMLTVEGYRVHLANGGKPALRFLQTMVPDLILLDIMMPDMDGYQVCKQVKADERTRDVPVIFISAMDQTFDKVKAFRSGAVDYIVKPFEIEEVFARIETHLALSGLKKELEQRVQERTADLIGANEQLRQEIAERKRWEGVLREQEHKIRRLMDSNIIGVCFWNMDGEIKDSNDEFLRIIGYTRESLNAGKVRWRDMTPPEWHSADAIATVELLKSGSCPPYEKEYIRQDGSRIPILIGGAFLDDSLTDGIGFVIDRTEQKRAEQRIHYLAHHDALTGLPNRVLFEDRVNQAITHAHRERLKSAMLFIDLDDFKDINDSLGHQVGDNILRRVARRLQSLLREEDTVGRLGGDEFAISLPAISDGNDAMLVAQKVLDALRQPFWVEGYELHVRASVGVSLYPDDGEDVETLMRTADTAMYYAKERGRDNYQFFTPTLNAAAQRRLVVANQLRQALQQHVLVVHYQPQVNLETGRIFGAEALIRWYKADGGLAFPGDFIKVAEETGLIVSLDEWMLRQVCGQLRHWSDSGHTDLLISINLSPYQFRRSGFPDFASSVLCETGVPASMLEMEITEGTLMLQSQDNLAALEQLTAMGIRLSVDDFGTGYSSLAYLQRFPVRALKIDQSFIKGLEHDANNASIVTAIIAMAKSLNLDVIAEGVETYEQVRFLRSRGCLKAQGFFYSKAVPAERFSQMLENGSLGIDGLPIAS